MVWVLVAGAYAQEGPDRDPAYRFIANWQLPKQDGLYERWDPNRSWASAHVVSTLQVVAERLALELPLADPLMIGDISRKGGGHMEGHSTHHLGIDVDIGIFMDDARQPLGGFVDVEPSRMDLHANWVLIRALMDTEQMAFTLLDQSLIDALRDYVSNTVGLDKASVEAIFPPPTRRLSWSVRNVIRHAPNHKHHFHVRLVPPQLEDELPPPIASISVGPRAARAEDEA
ncbi:MAG: penicillin-insensitive murein endopeptidase [Myxococcota bacterium]